jgi:hypothetical protein
MSVNAKSKTRSSARLGKNGPAGHDQLHTELECIIYE